VSHAAGDAAPDTARGAAPRAGSSAVGRAVARAARAVVRARLFVGIALTYAYFYQGGDPNQVTRVLLARAIVERRAPDITPDQRLTVDKAIVGSRVFADKAPGVSFAAVPVVALLDAADRAFDVPDDRGARRARMHALVVAIAGTAGVAAAWLVWTTLVLLGASRRIASLTTFAYAFGTLAFPFSTVLFGHQVAAALAMACFHRYARERTRAAAPSPGASAGVGALAASAIVVEYPAAILVGVVGAAFLARAWRRGGLARAIGFGALGAAPPLALHGAYLAWAFGSPFDLAYRHVVDPVFLSHTSTGLLGVGAPTASALRGALVSPFRGLFFFCPVLALTFAGLARWLADATVRAEAVVAAAAVVASTWFCCSYYAWHGDLSLGPRHLVPALPFFAMPIAFFARDGAARAALVALLALVSAAIVLACTAVLVHLPTGVPNPLYDIVWPALVRGDVAINRMDPYASVLHADAADNLGRMAGLGARASVLAPLAAIVLLLASYAPPGARRRGEARARRAEGSA